MPTYPAISIIEGQPTFEKPMPEILSEVKMGGAIKILDPLEYHTERQRNWYKGICLPCLADNGDTVDEWDLRLKAECNGNELLKKETIYLGPGTTCNRLTIVGVGKKNMTAFINNIISYAIKEALLLDPPDPDLIKK